MRTVLARTLWSLCWPALVPLVAAMLWLRSPAAPSASQLWEILPDLALGAAAILGWRFNRTRILFAALTLGLAHEAVRRAGGVPAVFHAVAVLLPLNVALCAWSPERGLRSWTALARWGLLAAQAAVVYELLAPAHAGFAVRLAAPVFGLPSLPGLPFAEPALLATALAALLLLARFVHARGPIDSGLLGALAGAMLALATPPGSIVSQVYATAAGLVLILAVVETSYTLAFRDELTSLPSRRALNEALRELGGHYVIAMVDVDHFKKFNDKHGHDAGDQALRFVASRLAAVGGGGRAFRYGGEEFTVLFPGKSPEEAAGPLAALCRDIAGSRFTVRGARRPRRKPASPRSTGERRQASVTVSIGAAAPEGRGATPEAVIKVADKRLYKAKKGGRNQVVAA